MARWTGFFNNSGSPSVRVSIKGVVGSGQEFDAVIDTGFTGFVAMPLIRAFPLGLVLLGTTTIVLADGSTQPRLTAYGGVVVPGETIPGVIILDAGSADVLLGMDFLQKVRRILQIDAASTVVELVEDSGTQPTAIAPPPAAE